MNLSVLQIGFSSPPSNFLTARGYLLQVKQVSWGYMQTRLIPHHCNGNGFLSVIKEPLNLGYRAIKKLSEKKNVIKYLIHSLPEISAV